eukprot:scaffold524_cov390-Prasinococcus_capsulatus_cf.AAC.4
MVGTHVRLLIISCLWSYANASSPAISSFAPCSSFTQQAVPTAASRDLRLVIGRFYWIPMLSFAMSDLSTVAPFRAGPYVARASGSSASICLQPQVDGERILGIHYRTALTDGCVSGHVPMSQSEYQYAKHLVCAELRDLRPQTSYIYAIEDSSHRLHKGGSFSTFADRAHPSSSAPGSMSKEPFKVRLAAIADCGEGGKGARLVRNALFNHSSHDHEDQPHMQVSASALLVAGDIAYEHGTLKDYTKKYVSHRHRGE